MKPHGHISQKKQVDFWDSGLRGACTLMRLVGDSLKLPGLNFHSVWISWLGPSICSLKGVRKLMTFIKEDDSNSEIDKKTAELFAEDSDEE